MIDTSALSLPLLGGLFTLAALVVMFCGVKLTHKADEFASQSGIGGAITGIVLLGALTSLSGSITSVVAATRGHPELPLSNAIGGIAAQTFFLVIADLVYRRANLEHAAASVSNMISGSVLIILLAMLLMAITLPSATLFHIHPVTPALFLVYLVGLKFCAQARDEPGWAPYGTTDPDTEKTDETQDPSASTTRLLMSVIGLGVICGGAGWVIADTGLAIAAKTGVREGIVGTLMTSIVTSLPELVTTIAAVRRGALTLAVGGILGGNTFDVLFAAFADVGYTDGSIYHAAAADQVFMIHISMAMTAMLLMGLLRRERSGPANIGFESLALLVLYIGGISAVIFAF